MVTFILGYQIKKEELTYKEESRLILTVVPILVTFILSYKMKKEELTYKEGSQTTFNLYHFRLILSLLKTSVEQ